MRVIITIVLKQSSTCLQLPEGSARLSSRGSLSASFIQPVTESPLWARPGRGGNRQGICRRSAASCSDKACRGCSRPPGPQGHQPSLHSLAVKRALQLSLTGLGSCSVTQHLSWIPSPTGRGQKNPLEGTQRNSWHLVGTSAGGTPRAPTSCPVTPAPPKDVLSDPCPSP